MGAILATDEKHGLTATRTKTASNPPAIEITDRAGNLRAAYIEIAGVGWLETNIDEYQRAYRT